MRKWLLLKLMIKRNTITYIFYMIRKRVHNNVWYRYLKHC